MTVPETTVRIRELTVRNVKILADQTFSFVRDDGSIRTWTVLLGDNGVCKTTVLQAIALASNGDKMARKLVQDATDYVRHNRADRDVEIRAEFETDWSPSLCAQMLIKTGQYAFSGDEGAEFLDRIRDRRESGYFVVGYGTGRRLPRPGEVAISRDPVADRVEGLFDTSHKMLGIDFFEALRERELGPTYARTIRDVLLEQDANGESLLPWLVNMELRGAGGVNRMEKLLESRRLIINVDGEPIWLPPHLLSQGYQSTFAWVADLLGHAFLDAGREVDPQTLEGIVLLDEIDLHLHPTWQRRLVPILRQVFPRLQFVVTTHSPLVLTGFEADEIIGLTLKEGEVVQQTYVEQPGLQTGSELMEGFFGVSSAGRPDLLVLEREALELSVKEPRSPEEEQRLAFLRRKLARYLEDTSFAAEDPSLDEDEPR